MVGAELQSSAVQIESRLEVLVFEGVVPDLLTVDGRFQGGHLGITFRGQLSDLHTVIWQNALGCSVGQQQLAEVGMSVILGEVERSLAVPVSGVEDDFSLQQIFGHFLGSKEAGHM